jgi:tetratricopeptide (TPR) repeat protein
MSSTRQTRHILTKLTSLVVISGLLAVGYLATMRAGSEITTRGARDDYDRLRAGKRYFSDQHFAEIEASLTKGLSLDPGSPHLLEDLARVQTTMIERGATPERGNTEPLSDEDSPKALTDADGPAPPELDDRDRRIKALELFEQVLATRPTSAHAYANVAVLKYQLGEIDRQFSNALEQALLRGPWETQIQIAAIELGLATWQALPHDLRVSVSRAIYRMAHWKLDNQRAAIDEKLVRYRRSDLRCLTRAGPNACVPL